MQLFTDGKIQMDATILAIETSCDETACAIVRNGTEILSNVVSTQINLHEKFGGVVPELASRKHLEYIDLVIQEALSQAGCTLDNLDAVAVTYGPGLVGALLVGVSTAKALAYGIEKPLIGVHHIEGHIYANLLSHPSLSFPCICLVVSGGHTNIIKISDHGQYESIGKTLDDAAGEAFDKVARAIGLGYPGGPKIDKLSYKGDRNAIAFPRAKLASPYDFSFSGLKSAVLNYLNRENMMGNEVNTADVAASFQAAVVDVLLENTMLAAQHEDIKTILLAGGVSANSVLRETFKSACLEKGYKLYAPEFSFCTDNAAMIGSAAYFKWLRQEFAALDLNAVAQLPFADYIEDIYI